MQRSLARAATVALLALSVSVQAQEPAVPPRVAAPLAIRNARIVPEPGRLIERGTIVIRDGRIVAVGPDVDIPAGAQVIDAEGQTAYAGFIDGLSRAGVQGEARRDADAERRVEGRFPDISETPQVVTPDAVRTGIFADRRVQDTLEIEDKTFDDLRAAGFAAALLAPPRALLGGSGSLVALGTEPVRDSVLRDALLQTASFERPPRRSLLDRAIYPATPLGVIAHLRQTFADVAWYGDMRSYVAGHPRERHALPFDAQLEALLAVQQGRVPLLWEAGRADEIHRVLDITKEFGLPVMIAGGREAWHVLPELKERRTAVVLSLALPAEARSIKPAQRDVGGAAGDDELFGKPWQARSFWPPRAYEEAARRRADVFENPLRLAEAGLRWCFSTADLDKPRDAFTNISEFLRHGLTHDAALQALTVTPAELFGAGDILGTLAPGKVANVTLLSHPLGEKDARVTHVVVAGRLFEQKARDRKGAGRRDGSADEEDEDDDQAQEDDEEEDGDEQPDQPASQPESAPALAVDWSIETDADRIPAWRTGGDVLLENALVLTITQGDLAETSVLVRDGKIAAVGRDLAAPAGVRRVDLRGYVVMPGMFDPHSHLALDAVNEWSMSVTPEVRCADVLRHDSPGLYWALSGGVTGMHCMHGSANSIGGQNVLIKCRYGKGPADLLIADAPRTVKFATGENVKRPGTVDMRWDRDTLRRFPGTRMGVETTMRRAFTAGQEYQQQVDAARAAGYAGPPLRRDLRLEALADILRGDIWVNTHCYRADEILRLLQTAEDFGVRIAALHHVLEGYRIMPEIHRHGAGTATFADWWAYKVEAYEAVPHNAAMMLAYGINSAIKSDSGDLVRHMNQEAAKAVRFGGLAPADALRLVTYNAARLFGLHDRLGSIEVGKDADIAVFDGHPLDSFARCVLTLVDGEAYFVHPDFDPDGPPAPRAVRDFSAPPAKGRNPETINIRRPGPQDPTHERARWAIVNATVHPVSGPPIEDAHVLIEGERIAAVGKVAIPGDFTQIDATGLHVWPGLIDAASHVGLEEISQVTVTMDTSEPGTYQPDVTAVSAVHPHSAMIEVTRAEGVTTCVVIPDGARVAGQAGAIHLDGWTLPEMLAAERVGLVVTLPTTRPKGLLKEDEDDPNEDEDDDSPRRRRGNVDFDLLAQRRLEDFFENAQRYAAARAAGDATLATDPRYDAMIPYVRGELPVLFDADGVKNILEAVTFARRYELKPVILGGRDAWKLADWLADQQVPVIYDATFSTPGRLPGAGNATDAWDGNYRGLATLVAAGVKVCAARRGADLAKNLPFDVAFAIAHGLSPEDGLRVMTLSAAEIFGLEQDLGSLEAGKLANVIVTSDHPSQVTGRVEHVFIRGRPVELASKHTRNAEMFAGRPAPQLPPAPQDLAGSPSQSRPR